jgi:hypothetical protein
VSLYTSVVITVQRNVTVSSEELTANRISDGIDGVLHKAITL